MTDVWYRYIPNQDATVERAAQALFEVTNRHCVGLWERTPSKVRDYYRHRARVVIESALLAVEQVA
jgi:hypothetical protein